MLHVTWHRCYCLFGVRGAQKVCKRCGGGGSGGKGKGGGQRRGKEGWGGGSGDGGGVLKEVLVRDHT